MAPLLVVVLDVGTTYSGYGCSFRHDFETDPTKIYQKPWLNRGASYKCPTSVLMTPSKQFHSFGYEAQDKYAQLAECNEYRQWYFFERFRMKTFRQIGKDRNLMLEDSCGNKMRAIEVISAAIKFLKDDCLKTLEKRVIDITIHDIKWVITVPTLSSDAGKQFIKEAAVKAGLEQVEICLETEAAAISGLYQINQTKSSTDSKRGTKFLTFDMGGGKSECGVHEILPNQKLREVYKVTELGFCGAGVDDKFDEFANELFGTECIDRIKREHMEDYLDFLREMECKKRSLHIGKEKDIVTLKVPGIFEETLKKIYGVNFKERLPKTKYRDSIFELRGDKLRMESKILISLFDDTTNLINKNIQLLLAIPELSGCSVIILTGGLAEAPIIGERVIERFKNIDVLTPEDPMTAVIRGGLIFGHVPEIIVERKCKYTYGFDTTHPFSQDCKHPPGRKETDKNGKMRCWDIFCIAAKSGQSLKVDEEAKEIIVNPLYDTQKSIQIDIFASENDSPDFVTDPGCTKIGALTAAIPDTTLGRKRKYGVTFKFGDTVIKVKVVDKTTGTETIARVDFLG